MAAGVSLGGMRTRGAATVVLATLVGCQALASLDDHAAKTELEAGLSDATLDAPGDETRPPCGLDRCPTDCSVLYVDSTVDAQASGGSNGCLPAAPKKSIGEALAAATNKTIEVRVCSGVYRESLVWTREISLRGGYACRAWTRGSEYRYPQLDRTLQTTIEPLSPNDDTLLVTAASAGTSYEIEGFTIHGSLDASAVKIKAGSAPRVVHNRISGSQSTATGSSSGLSISAATTAIGPRYPEVAYNEIEGGAGHSNSSDAGSVGVEIKSVAAVHDNRIRGGTGEHVGYGSIGALVNGAELTGAYAFHDNTVFGGEGRSQLNTSTGVLVYGKSRVEIVSNVIEAGDGTWTGVQANSFARGIYVLGDFTPGVRIERNRIVARSFASKAVAELYGISIERRHGTLIANNMILVGRSDATTYPKVVSGIGMTSSNTVVVRHNTIHVGATVATGGKASAVRSFGAAGTLLDNNLFLGRDNAPALSVGVEDDCVNPVASMKNNAFALFAGPLWTCMGQPVTAQALNASTPACADNVRLASSCVPADSACTPCNAGSPAACAAQLFSNFATVDDGAGNLLAADGGWRLSNGASCAIADGGLNLTIDGGAVPPSSDAGLMVGFFPPVTTDLYGTTRAPPISRGAEEALLPCN